MSHVTPEMRRIMVMAKKAGKKTKEVAEFPGVSKQTINVLKKQEGSPCKGGKKSSNYFRAKSPNDLQLEFLLHWADNGG